MKYFVDKYKNKVIPFPRVDLIDPYVFDREPATYESPINQQPPEEAEEKIKKPVIIEVMPGEALPEGYTDYRPYLQRDGLILFSWEYYDDGIKIIWLKSNGNIQRYEAWLENNEAVLPTLCPEHRYSTWKRRYQETPDRIVFTAPSGLTLNTRDTFISKLRESGITIDFNYNFSLGDQKTKKEMAVADKIMKCRVKAFDPSTGMNFLIQPLLDAFIDELYEDGTVDRWNQKKTEQDKNRRRDVMLTAWGYRKHEGLSMSDALKRAWELARYFYAA